MDLRKCRRVVFILLANVCLIINIETAEPKSGKEATYDTKKRFVTEQEIDVIAELQALKAEFQAFKISANKTAWSTFTRWGKNDCPNIAELVYRGYIAGKKYNDHGSASDNLCLPNDPTWAKYDDVHQGFRALVYGTELDSWTSQHIFDKNVFNEDMPCVVCRTIHPTTLMIPARTNCYPGWTMQYHGYLVSNIAGDDRGTHDSLCIDMDPDFIPHSEVDNNEHVLYLTEAKCGSLPCPPYVDNRELACAVCSK